MRIRYCAWGAKKRGGGFLALAKLSFRAAKELFKNTYTHRPSDHIKSLKLKPNSIRIQYSSEGPQFLALSQNHHPNWAVYIDGKQSQIQHFNHSLMSVAVPAGKHEVLFIFSSFATVLWWFSLFGFLGIIFGPLLIATFILLVKIYKDEFGVSNIE